MRFGRSAFFIPQKLKIPFSKFLGYKKGNNAPHQHLV